MRKKLLLQSNLLACYSASFHHALIVSRLIAFLAMTALEVKSSKMKKEMVKTTLEIYFEKSTKSIATVWIAGELRPLISCAIHMK